MPSALAPEPTLEMPADRMHDLGEALEARLAELPPDDIAPEPEAAHRAAAAETEVKTQVSRETKADNTATTETKTGTGEAGAKEVEGRGSRVEGDPKPEATDQQQAKPDGKGKSKFAQEQERGFKSWKEFQEEKTREREALAKERAQLQQEHEQRVKQQEAREREWQEQHPEYTPEQYETAAREYEKRGQLETADLLRAQAKAAQARPAQAKPGTGLSTEAKQSFARVAKEFPEFADAKHALHGELKKMVLEERPELLRIPDGPYLAAQHIRLAHAEATARQTASRVPVLEKENAELKAENERLKKLTSVDGSGGPARLPDGSQKGNLSVDEEGAALRRELGGRSM